MEGVGACSAGDSGMLNRPISAGIYMVDGSAAANGHSAGCELSGCCTRRTQVSVSAGACMARRSSLSEMTGRSRSTAIPSAKSCLCRGMDVAMPRRTQNPIRIREQTAHVMLRRISTA